MKSAGLAVPDSVPGPSLASFCPQIHVGDFKKALRGEREITFRFVEVFPQRRFRALVHLARSRSVNRIFEIGTFYGATALSLCEAGFDVHCLDLRHPVLRPEGDDGEWRWLVPERTGILFEGTSVVFHEAPYNGSRWSSDDLRRSFDLVFIDGDHRLQSVLRDQEIALSLVKPGGTIVWDDAALEGVGAAIERFEAEHGVVAVDPGIGIAWWPQ